MTSRTSTVRAPVRFTGRSGDSARLRATQYTNINFRNSDGISHYNALVARIQMNNLQKMGLTLNANYTYGHTLDELSDTFSSSGNNFNLGYLDPFNPGRIMAIRYWISGTASPCRRCGIFHSRRAHTAS